MRDCQIIHCNLFFLPTMITNLSLLRKTNPSILSTLSFNQWCSSTSSFSSTTLTPTTHIAGVPLGETSNVPPTLIPKVGRNLHLQKGHPLNTIKQIIESHVGLICSFDPNTAATILTFHLLYRHLLYHRLLYLHLLYRHWIIPTSTRPSLDLRSPSAV
jgi:hypothetical protein